MSQQTEKVAEKALKDLELILDDYIEIVNYDKTFQSSDYDSLLLNLDKLVVRIDNLSQELEKNKIEMEDLKPLLEALNSSVLAH